MKSRAILWVCFTLLAAGCGRERQLQLGEFAPYVHSFEIKSDEAGHSVRVDNLIVEYGEMSKATEQGFCLLKGGETPVIRINADAWARLNETERQLLIFHELGHCVLGRPHTVDLIAPAIPKSLMNPYALDARIYSEYEAHYDVELFAP